MTYSITLNLYENKLENRYVVTFINGNITLYIVRKCNLFVVCYEVKVQKCVMYLFALVHMV